MFGWAVGEAWSYRRSAYKKMALILSEKRGPRVNRALTMCDEIYSREEERTKNLHQERTPPMSTAAREAREAIVSINL